MKAMCFVARERLQKKLKFLELLTFFPRAEVIANMNINFQKIFVIQMNFLTLKGGRKVPNGSSVAVVHLYYKIEGPIKS